MSRTPEPEETRDVQERASYTVARPTLIGGQWLHAGDEVELYPAQARWAVHGGYIEGHQIDDAFGPGELAHGADNVLKRASERDDIEVAPSVDEMFEQHDIGYGAEGEQAGETPGSTSTERSSESSSVGSEQRSSSVSS